MKLPVRVAQPLLLDMSIDLRRR
ncbi:MAG: hypothetical protein RL693_364, partial [Verrucomicrobiota bacterium]